MFNKQARTDNQQHGFNGGCGSHFGRKFGDKFNEAFGGDAPWSGKFAGKFGNRKSANIEENETAFVISLYAAGLNKSDFKISATEDVLTISYAPSSQADKSNFTHIEYEPSPFERSFQLNGKVLTDAISATYTDGVLKVSLVKNPEAHKPAQEVKVD